MLLLTAALFMDSSADVYVCEEVKYPSINNCEKQQFCEREKYLAICSCFKVRNHLLERQYLTNLKIYLKSLFGVD